MYYSIEPHFNAVYCSESLCYLLSDQGHHYVQGPVYPKLFSFIEKNMSDDEMASSLSSEIAAAEVFFMLMQLESMNYITRCPDARPSASQVPCISLSTEYKNLYSQYILSFKSTQPLYHDENRTVIDELHSYNTAAADHKNTIDILLCHSYLEPELKESIHASINNGHYVFPVKVSGSSLWAGPFFGKGSRACWQCLLFYMQHNFPIETFLLKKGLHHERVLGTDKPYAPYGRSAVFHGINTLVRVLLPHIDRSGLIPVSNPGRCNSGSAATCQEGVTDKQRSRRLKVSVWATKDSYEPTSNQQFLSIVDMTSQKETTHVLYQRPQCPDCGDISMFAQQATAPLTLQRAHRQKYTHLGGFRYFTPTETFNTYKHLIDPITGIIARLEPYKGKNHPLRPVWQTTFYSQPCQTAGTTHPQFIKKSFGKGATQEQARASALCEAIERYSLIYQGDEPSFRASFDELKPRAVSPVILQNFSSQQYALRENCSDTELSQQIPLPFDEHQPISWTYGWSLSYNEQRFIPLSYCYANTALHEQEQEHVCLFNPNGHASGNTFEEAVLQGILELVERDAVAIWWYNQLKRPSVHLASFDDPYFINVRNHYNEYNWDMWVLDLTHDLAIPAAIAVAFNKDKGGFIAGMGAHLDMKLAVQRAITEMHQLFIPQERHQPLWHISEFSNPDFLFPDTQQPSVPFSRRFPVHTNRTETGAQGAAARHEEGEYSTYVADKQRIRYSASPCCDRSMYETASDCQVPAEQDIYDDIMYCMHLLKDKKLELIAVNYTRPDIGLPSVKIIIPGLRHFWKRVGPGRLYEVPVTLGWLAQCKKESELNPLPLLV